MVDADPQASLTFYLNWEEFPQAPTLLEVLRQQVPPHQGIYPISAHLSLMPASDALDEAQVFLADSGMGATVLKRRLQTIQQKFDVCVIDAPPQRSQVCLTALGAAQEVLIPAEASSKGVNSMMRTLDLINRLQQDGGCEGQVTGVIPFRDRWIGRTQASQSRRSVEIMREQAAPAPLLPSMLESEQFKKAMDLGTTLSEIGYPDLEHPLTVVVDILQRKYLWPMP